MKIKKIIALFFSFVILSISCLSYATAANLGNLTYWYDQTGNNIGHWDHNPSMYSHKLNTDSTFYYSTAVAEARTQWKGALKVSFSLTSSDADINYYGGTLNELDDLYIFWLGSFDLGQTTWDNTLEGTYTWNSKEKSSYIQTSASSCLISKGLTSSEYKKTATHELGHAMGYYGHDTYSTSVMTQGKSSQYTLNSRDKNHLSQVY